MKIILCLVIFFTVSLNTFPIFAAAIDKNNQAQNTVFQVATIGALAQGVYDGDYDYGRLMKQGNFGVGTFLDLNGEMVAIDGHSFSCKNIYEKNIL